MLTSTVSTASLWMVLLLLVPNASTVLTAPGLPPGLANVSFPLAYMQSSFVTGHHNGVPCRAHGNINPTLTREQRLDALRVYASNATSFKGGEMFINTLETQEALADVREMNSLILQVASETRTPPFWGFWIPARMPGMWWPSNYTAQPGACVPFEAM
jgi:hypothetical protein